MITPKQFSPNSSVFVMRKKWQQPKNSNKNKLNLHGTEIQSHTGKASNFICINFLIDYKTIIDLHVTNESNESTTDFFSLWCSSYSEFLMSKSFDQFNGNYRYSRKRKQTNLFFQFVHLFLYFRAFNFCFLLIFSTHFVFFSCWSIFECFMRFWTEKKVSVIFLNFHSQKKFE